MKLQMSRWVAWVFKYREWNKLRTSDKQFEKSMRSEVVSKKSFRDEQAIDR